MKKVNVTPTPNNADCNTARVNSLVGWYVKHLDDINVILAPAAFVGVPVLFGLIVLFGEISKVVATDLSGMLFWASFYVFLGAIVLLFIIGDLLKVMKYQRPAGESTVNALYSIYRQEDSTTSRKVLVILFCLTYQLLLISMASAVGVQLSANFILGAYS